MIDYVTYEQRLRDKVLRLRNDQALTFILTCAQRQSLSYFAFCKWSEIGNITSFKGLIDRCWKHLVDSPMSSEEAEELREVAFGLAPPEDFSTPSDAAPSAGVATYACSSLMDACNFISRQDNAYAVRCGLNSYEAVKEEVFRECMRARFGPTDDYSRISTRSDYSVGFIKCQDAAHCDPRTEREISFQISTLEFLPHLEQLDLVRLIAARDPVFYFLENSLGYKV